MKSAMQLTVAVVLLAGCTRPRPAKDPVDAGSGRAEGSMVSPARAIEPRPGEKHFRAIRQVTFGGENAEAYFSHDGQWLTMQSTRDGRSCDQQYVMRVDGSDIRRISDGRGKTTCGWFFPGDKRLFFASTTAHDSACP
ncbi:MAG TPA: hypothetical protein VHM24_13600, partial [Gemmatimonadaceae bacterium]|nr:hypothetical protein [Gemmatimonadaceae bacterium]